MAMPSQQTAQADYLWCAQHLPADTPQDFKAKFFDLGINSGYLAGSTSTASADTALAADKGKGKGGGKKKLTPEQLLAVIERYPGLTIAELAQKTGGWPATIGTMLKRGKALVGRVTEIDGKWQTTGASGQVANIAA
jgi:hypothetical protein